MSRYPAMSQAPVTYDRSLLVDAPSITRQDRQAGYDVNALERGPYPQPYTTAVPTIGQPVAPAPEAANPFQDGYYNRTFSPSTPPSSTPVSSTKPWWRRKRWAALALIIFLGIICGIVAGVVTARNSRNSSVLVADPQSAASGPSASSPPVQSPTSTEDPLASQATITTPVAPAPVASSNGPAAGNPGTTLFFGPATTLPPGATLPTATVPDPNFGGQIPSICYVAPTLSQCAPYFQDPPRV